MWSGIHEGNWRSFIRCAKIKEKIRIDEELNWIWELNYNQTGRKKSVMIIKKTIKVANIFSDWQWNMDQWQSRVVSCVTRWCKLIFNSRLYKCNFENMPRNQAGHDQMVLWLCWWTLNTFFGLCLELWSPNTLSTIWSA